MGKSKRFVSFSKNGNGRFCMILLTESVGLSILVAWVFYNSVWGLVLFPLSLGFCYKNLKKKQEEERNSKFDIEFKEVLVSLSDALQSGYSIENAFKDAEDSLRLLYGSGGMIIEDIKILNSKISMHMPAERALEEFVAKYPTEEAIGFSGVFSFARRLGGGYVQNIKRTVEKMEDKLELKADIRSAIAEKQMEFKVMCAMPIGILMYVKVTSKEFLESMYGSILGVTVMSICLLVYVVAFFLGKRIVDIRV